MVSNWWMHGPTDIGASIENLRARQFGIISRKSSAN
jgi:hypothetical protein